MDYIVKKFSFKIILFIVLNQLIGCAGPITNIPSSSKEEIKREVIKQRKSNTD